MVYAGNLRCDSGAQFCELSISLFHFAFRITVLGRVGPVTVVGEILSTRRRDGSENHHGFSQAALVAYIG